MSAKTANVTARIQPEIKEQAEAILSQLGIPGASRDPARSRSENFGTEVSGCFVNARVLLRQGVPAEAEVLERP